MRSLRKSITRMAFAVPLLVLAATPAQADIANVGGGVVVGTVNFSQGGVPTLGLGCTADQWHFSANAAAVVIDLVNDAAQGLATVSATGSSDCANSIGEHGPLSVLTADIAPTSTPLGFNVGSNFSCGHDGTLPVGGYQRVGTHVHVDVQVNCQINGVTPKVEFITEGEFIPNTAPNAQSEFTSAAFAAGFAVGPPF